MQTKIIAVSPYTLNNQLAYNIITLEQPTLLYTEQPDGSYLGTDSSNTFNKYYAKSKTKGAFKGSPIDITTTNGEVVQLQNYWWDAAIPEQLLHLKQRAEANVMGLKGSGSQFSPRPLTIDTQRLTGILLTEDVEIVKNINQFLQRR